MGALLAFVACLLVVAAGCRVDAAVDVAMAPNGSGTVTVTATADAELVRAVPGLAADVRLGDATAAGWTVQGPKPVDGGLQVVLTKPFSTPEEGTEVLAEVSGPDGPLRGLRLAQDRGFALVQSSLTGTAGLDRGLRSFADDALTGLLGSTPLADRVTDQQLQDGFHLAITARLAGRVTTANGDVAADRTSVSWAPPAGTAVTLEAHFTATDAGARSAQRTERLAEIAIVGWLLVAGVVALLLWRRHGRRPAEPPTPAARR